MIDGNVSYPELPYPSSADKRRDRFVIILTDDDHFIFKRLSAKRPLPDMVIMMSWDLTRGASNKLMPKILDVLAPFKVKDNLYTYSEQVPLALLQLSQKNEYLEFV